MNFLKVSLHSLPPLCVSTSDHRQGSGCHPPSPVTNHPCLCIQACQLACVHVRCCVTTCRKSSQSEITCHLTALRLYEMWQLWASGCLTLLSLQPFAAARSCWASLGLHPRKCGSVLAGSRLWLCDICVCRSVFPAEADTVNEFEICRLCGVLIFTGLWHIPT